MLSKYPRSLQLYQEGIVVILTFNVIMLDNIYSKFIMGQFLLQVSYAHALLSFFTAMKLSWYNHKHYYKLRKKMLSRTMCMISPRYREYSC